MKKAMLFIAVVAAIFTGCLSSKNDGLVENTVVTDTIYRAAKPSVGKKPALAPSTVCSTDTAKGEKQPVIRAY